jgi:hypothetical protein
MLNNTAYAILCTYYSSVTCRVAEFSSYYCYSVSVLCMEHKRITDSLFIYKRSISAKYKSISALVVL